MILDEIEVPSISAVVLEAASTAEGRAMAETLHGRFTGIDLDELVDRRVVLTWLYWGMFWLIVTPSVGVALSGLFNYPDYLGTNNLGLTFGRLRPVHVNGVIFGAF